MVSEVEFLGLRTVLGIGIVTEDFCCKTKTPSIAGQSSPDQTKPDYGQFPDREKTGVLHDVMEISD